MSTDAPESTDDLSKPLGQKKKKRKTRVAVPMWVVSRSIAGLLGLCVAVLAGWILLVDEPYGGEPMAMVSAYTRPPPAKAGETVESATKPDPAASVAEGQKSGQTVTIIDGSTGKRQEVSVGPAATKGGQKAGAKGEAKPDASIDPRFLDNSRHGPIPKIAPDGARPSDVYAKPPKPQAARPDAPRIAIVVEGLGIGANSTTEALAKLPSEITMAFTPYGVDLERWVARARGEGREVLLQVGMEPFDFPDNDPGPQTLLTSNTAELNIDRLHWFLSRFQGYVGITTLMGARFTATDQALSPVLREVGKRGLIYFDDGTSPRSVAGQMAGSQNVAFARADAVLDAVPTASDIDSALARLEATARSRGVAIASASALPVTIDRIANWARSAPARGLALVPVSAVANRAKTSS
ncbi:MAG TPA: divergent polysaccharide deacetylase family protein [Xanthobacteraceae bacterium]|nr:divergent polysaccharide deacetylase family protein [Xanthobacteraceae bacterium]